MAVRIFDARAIESALRKILKPVGRQVQVGMLASEDERGRPAALGQGLRNRCKLDGFGPRPDDERDVSGSQPSP